ncbi:MAG TPA: triose-phosphate isomerase [Candidatus Baltobacteraceae bacterium]|nr:triose-phosphate isomerase [Candidatus Baltobacteraceae bacterium]
MRRCVCVANWKMNKTNADAAAFVERFMQLVPSIPQEVELVLCPPFTALHTVASSLDAAQGPGGRVKLGAQNMHWQPSGACTGEISAPMLLEIGVQYVILGHSERRQYFGETDETVRLKTGAALANGLTPIVAVGESLDLRREGRTQPHVCAQTFGALAGLEPADVRKVILAYEPIWAIGTGENCDPAGANEVMRAMRGCIDGLLEVPILYGGSVKAENIAAYTALSDIDGGLVGGASLDPDAFAELAKNAALPEAQGEEA